MMTDNIDDFRNEAAQATAAKTWTVQRVIKALPHHDPWSLLEVRQSFIGDQEDLKTALRHALLNSQGPARLHAGTALLRLQDNAGAPPVLEGLASSDPDLQTRAFQCLRGLAPIDSTLDNLYFTKTPITGAELFAAIAPLLAEPTLPNGLQALNICLQHDIVSSRPITRQLLAHPAQDTRLLVAQCYIRQGRDDGALAVMEDLFAQAPLSHDTGRYWNSLKSSWFDIRTGCKAAVEPVRSHIAELVMRVVNATLDAPDAREFTNGNTGFISVGFAALVISYVMPAGAQSLLERIANSDNDICSGYDRGYAIRALVERIGVQCRPMLINWLEDNDVRQHAAAGIGEIAANTNDPELVQALARRLATEKNPEALGAILKALAVIGPSGKAHASLALENASPWDRMEIHCAIEGYSTRYIADRLVEVGAIDPIDDQALSKLGTPDMFELAFAAGNRLAMMPIKCSESPPPHDQLFQCLLDITRPRIDVELLVQTDNTGLRQPVADAPRLVVGHHFEVVCTISFIHENQIHSFSARPSGRWLDVGAVIHGYHSFMEAIGREDRCHQLLNESHALFLSASPAKFRAVAEQFKIPIEEAPEKARLAGMAYTNQVLGR
jgi:hypothetical protein